MDYALNEHGELVHADHAPRGQVYVCLDCAARVKLRRGEQRAPHFAHFGHTGCTGEGVLHHAAKLELARALRERQRPLTLQVPCCWPGCSAYVDGSLDHRLGLITEVVPEYTFKTRDDKLWRFDVAVLRHGQLEAGFEVYHHHRVEGAKREFSNWFEIEAAPLLEDPYTLKMVKDGPPLNPHFEQVMAAFLSGQQPDLTDVAYEAFYSYRAQGSGLWIEERGWEIATPVNIPLDPDIDQFRFYACEQHLHPLYQLDLAVARQQWPQDPVLPEPVPDPEQETESPYQAALKDFQRSVRFAGTYYQQQGVPAFLLNGLNLWACRCPSCGQAVVIVQNEFVPGIQGFQRLVARYQQRAINHCGHCRAVINRTVISQSPGQSLPGALVSAWMQEVQS